MLYTIICVLLLYCRTTTPQTDIPRDEPVITEAQEQYLARLEACESGGNYRVRIIDSNGLHSTGRFQFQDQTFLNFGKRYGLIPETTAKAEPLIYDGDLQKILAHKMLLDGGESHWFNCTRPLGRYPK